MSTWGDTLEEIRGLLDQAQKLQSGAVDQVRRKYLRALHEVTGRNAIAYYSGWLTKPYAPQNDITDEDKNGFMMAVHGMDRSLGLDLILHTPGGSIGATHSLVDYLRRLFGTDIRAIVPQIAMSAGTMIACCCKEILMARHSNLGPIDPHIGGLPAQGVIEEFERACREVAEDESRIPIWQSIIAQYGPAFLSRCENAILWSNEFVQKQLVEAMFENDPDGEKKAERIVAELSDYGQNRTHERHIHFDECLDLGLKVSLIEDDQDLQDVVLTVHHCFMHSLQNTSSFKIIENHDGATYVKQLAPVDSGV